MKPPAKLLGLFALWLVPLVATSAVRYEFSGFNSGDFGGPSDNPISFVLESDGFITTTSTPIPASVFASCSAGSGECVEIQFFIDTVISPPAPIAEQAIAFSGFYVSPISSGITISYHYFSPGAFSQVGVHSTDGPFNPATLVVSVVPEVATAHLMLIGLASAGLALLRKHQ